MASEGEELARGQPKKKQRKTPQAASMHSKSISVNAVKSKIRDVSRVLDHAQDLPMDVRIEKQRALVGYKQDLEKAQKAKERQRMIKKYHMVRFFERQKATRNLKKLRTSLASATAGKPERQTLDIDVYSAEVDLNYTIYHPLTDKYIGLFPRQNTHEKQDERTIAPENPVKARLGKPAMWAVVENCMKDGTLQALRDGKLRTKDDPKTPAQPPAQRAGSRKSQKQRKDGYQAENSRRPAVKEQEDESDGGFFEEE
ncbi:MAG: hypothetical protein Q9212_007346 [Teloschistes hypoglaucus]